MKHVSMVVFAVAAALSIALAGLAATRGPISILGDADFTEENGVLAGSGTASDPYIIAGWEIAVSAESLYGVRIENVTASFVLRGLMISGAGQEDGAAIRIGFATGGVIESCTVSSSLDGIELASSSDITIRNCALFVYGTGLNVTGESEAEYRHTIDSSNLLNDLAIHYYYGLNGERIQGIETKHLTIAASRDVTVVGNTVFDGDGIQLAFVTDSTVTANAAGRNSNVATGHAIQLYESQRNAVTANLVKNSRLAGVQLTLSSDNEISGNYLAVNDTGIRLIGSSGNSITGNELIGCYTAIWLAGGSDGNRIDGNVVVGKVSEDGDRRQGIVLDLASGNLIEGNGVGDCEIGIALEVQATSNEVFGNTIVAGAYGVFISGSYNEIARNLVAQQSRGILFPETYGRSVTRGNRFVGNVLADNGSHLYTNLDCESNSFAENLFLGDSAALVSDRGMGNRWSVSGVGNYWGGVEVEDADGDGLGDAAVMVYPSVAQDDFPLVAIDAADLRIGVLGTLSAATVRLERGDGTIAEVAAVIAQEVAQRWVGFRGFPASLAEAFPAILFVFESEAELRFTMATVPFDLDIVFFDAAGGLVGTAKMTAMASDLYTATGPFQYALELVSGRLAELAIDEHAKLVVPAAR